MKLVSVCVPCFNEEDNIERAYEVLSETLSGIEEVDYEIVFADNASTDGSQDILRRLAETDSRVKVILNARNFGAARSGMNCIMRSNGDAVISFPCDLQEPVEMIPVFVEKWLQGNPVVWGRKESTEEKGPMAFARKTYYRLMALLSDYPFYSQVDGFGIIDRAVLDDVRANYAPGRGMKVIVSSLGYPVCLVPYRQKGRKGGRSSYSVLSYCRTALDVLVEISTKPLFIIGAVSLFLAAFGAIAVVATVIWLIISGPSEGSVVLAMQALCILLLSLVLASVGIVGAYVGHLFVRSTPQPLVSERETINLKER